MISKVITGKTFYGACRYICMDEKRAIILETEGVRNYDWKLMAADFEMQHSFRPSLSKAVFHGILSFYPGEKIEDKKMTEIAKDYLQKMGITNTQYAITKHIDKNHSHVHIIANLVNNNGETIKDNWIGLKGKKIAQELTINYGLKEAASKNLSLIHLEQLNEKEANKYRIYQAIAENLSVCKTLDELKEKLQQQNIETLYKFKGQTNELQGISFKIGKYKYKGSEIDRKFSIKNLQKTIHQQQIQQIKQNTFASKSKLLYKNEHPEIKIQIGHNKTLLEHLMKPEQCHQQMPNQLLLPKKPEKTSKRLRL